MLSSRSGILAEAMNKKILTKDHPDSLHSYPDSPHSHPDSPHSHSHSPYFHPDSPCSNPDPLCSNPDSPCFHPDSPRSHPNSPRSHHSPHFVPRFPISAFPDNLNKVIFSYLNNNSIRNKFGDFDKIADGNIDILCIAETKLG